MDSIVSRSQPMVVLARHEKLQWRLHFQNQFSHRTAKHTPRSGSTNTNASVREVIKFYGFHFIITSILLFKGIVSFKYFSAFGNALIEYRLSAISLNPDISPSKCL